MRIPREAGEVVSRTGTIDVDQTIGLKPDLVVATQTADQLDVARIQGDRRGRVHPAGRLLLNVEQGAIDLGFLVGEASEARRLVGRIQQDVATIQQKLADVPPVSVFVDTGFFITVSDRSLLGDLVKRARGRASPARAPAGPVPARRSPEANPQFFLAASDSDTTLESLREPGHLRPRSGAKKRVVVVPAQLVNRAGPRVAQGLEAIARALHPDAFQ